MDIQKVNQFLNHLLMLPNIKQEPLVIAESIIVNFIKENYSKLSKTFNSPSFFPDVSPNEIIKALFNLLYQKVDKELKPFLNNIIEKEINFEFVKTINSSIKPDEFKNNFKTFITNIFTDINVRLNFKSIYYIFKTKAIDKYITKAIERKQAVYNELFRIQKIPLKKNEEIVNYLKLITLLSIGVYFKIPLSNSKPVNIIDFKTLENKIEFVNKLLNYLITNDLSFKKVNIDTQLLKSSFYSNFPEQVVSKNDGIARIIYIFLIRYKEYNPHIKVDRGAETPDKSWYSIALKNYKFIGANQNILNEFYLIAGDNMW